MKRKLIRRFQDKLKTPDERYFRKYMFRSVSNSTRRFWKFGRYYAWDEASLTRFIWVPLKMSSYCKKSKLIHISDGSQSCTNSLWESKCPGRLLNDTMLKSNIDKIRNLNLYEKKNTSS